MCIGQCNKNELNLRDIVKIYDAWPLLNASANKMKGGGFEACGHGKDYSNCSIQFCNIENIHGVRTCFEKMWALAY